MSTNAEDLRREKLTAIVARGKFGETSGPWAQVALALNHSTGQLFVHLY